MRNRSIKVYVADDIIESAKEVSETTGLSLSSIARLALIKYLREQNYEPS